MLCRDRTAAHAVEFCPKQTLRTFHGGKRRCWLGRTRTGAVPLRRRLLCPLSYEPPGPRPESNWRDKALGGWYLASRSRDLGALDPTRTGDLLLRREPRYPTALRGLACQPMGSTTDAQGDGFTGRCITDLPSWRGVDAGTRTLLTGPTTRLLDPSGRPPCAMEDSNLRPAGCGPAALAAELIALRRSPERIRTSTNAAS